MVLIVAKYVTESFFVLIDIICCSYHQKVAYDPPLLELKATYGLVSPEDYKPPELSPLWSPEVYKKMDAKMAPKPGPQVSRLPCLTSNC